MIPSLSQESITQYASDAQTIAEPQGADYSQGARVGKTIPAKWWNWLFSAVTKRIIQARADSQDMLDELKNVVSDAGLTPSSSDNTQLTQAITIKTNIQIDSYVEDKKGYLTDWVYLISNGTISIPKITPETYGTLGGLRDFKALGVVDECFYAYAAFYPLSAPNSAYYWQGIVFTTDFGTSWHTAAFKDLFSDISGISWINGVSYQCALVHLNNEWLMLVSINYTSTVYSCYLFKSTDLDSWARVGSTSFSTTYGYPIMTVAGDKLLIADRYDTYVYYNGSITTLTRIERIAAIKNNYGIICEEAIQMSDGTYITPNGVFDGTDLVESYLSSLFTDLRDAGYYTTRFRGLKARRLSTGDVLVTFIVPNDTSDSVYNAAVGANAPWYILHESAGQVTATRYNQSPTENSSPSDIFIEEIVGNRVIGKDSNYSSYYQSSDGITFTYVGSCKAPSYDRIVPLLYLKGKYILYNKISEDLTNWNDLPVPQGKGAVSVEANSVVTYQAPNSFGVGNITFDAYTLNEGQNILQMAVRAANSSSHTLVTACSPWYFNKNLDAICLLKNKTIALEEHDSYYAVHFTELFCVTQNSVNRVIGHTLYLR